MNQLLTVDDQTGLTEGQLASLFVVFRSKKASIQFARALRGLPFEDILAQARIAEKDRRREAASRKVAKFLGTDSGDRELSGKERTSLVYVLRYFALMGLPHKPTKDKAVTRVIRRGRNEFLRVTLTARGADEKIPEKDRVYLPHGITGRRVLLMLCTLAVKNQSPEISLDAAQQFMQTLGWNKDGRGGYSATRYGMLETVLEQLRWCTLDIEEVTPNAPTTRGMSINILKEYEMPSRSYDPPSALPLPYNPRVATTKFRVTMARDFYMELVGDPTTGYRGSAFPLPEWFIAKFKTSVQLDIAQYLVARVTGAKTSSRIKLEYIQGQLGICPSNFTIFKRYFRETLVEVQNCWSGCNAEIPINDENHLVVGPVKDGDYLVDPTKFLDFADDDEVFSRTLREVGG